MAVLKIKLLLLNFNYLLLINYKKEKAENTHTSNRLLNEINSS